MTRTTPSTTLGTTAKIAAAAGITAIVGLIVLNALLRIPPFNLDESDYAGA